MPISAVAGDFYSPNSGSSGPSVTIAGRQAGVAPGMYFTYIEDSFGIWERITNTVISNYAGTVLYNQTIQFYSKDGTLLPTSSNLTLSTDVAGQVYASSDSTGTINISYSNVGDPHWFIGSDLPGIPIFGGWIGPSEYYGSPFKMSGSTGIIDGNFRLVNSYSRSAHAESVSIVWDRQTGAMVELHDDVFGAGLDVKLVDTNAWQTNVTGWLIAASILDFVTFILPLLIMLFLTWMAMFLPVRIIDWLHVRKLRGTGGGRMNPMYKMIVIWVLISIGISLAVLFVITQIIGALSG